MRKAGTILFLGLLLCGAGFSGFYYWGTASCRGLLREPNPELAWLKKEFNLSESEFARIVKMHQAYLPQCAERCQRIAAQNATLRQLLAQTNTVTSAIERVLAERARLRAECETEMLKHFLAVSRSMPPEQGRRYLAWVLAQSSLGGGAMEMAHGDDAGPHD